MPDNPRETPMRMPMPPPSASLLLLPLLAIAAAATRTLTPPSNPAVAGGGPPPPLPTPWPEQFHALMFTNLTESGGRLQLIDLYYDWPRGRNLNLIHNQLSGDPLHDVEWTNGTSYIFDSASCRTIRFPVGILPPNWLDGAVYLGRESTDGFDCHLWTKVDFVWYWEDVVTHRPVRWNFFNGMQQHVMSFEVGRVLEDSKWQAPAHCFTDHATTTNGTDDEADAMSSLLRFTGAPGAAAAAVAAV